MSEPPRIRTTPRLPVMLNVAYQSTGEMTRDMVTNLGEGGLFIRTTKPLPIGTQIEMTIKVADSEPEIRQKGRVAWARGLGGDGMGVRFEAPVDPRIVDLLKAKKIETP